MNILVANPSYQTHRPEYRVPEIFDRDPRTGELSPKLFRVEIKPGRQVRLAPGDFTEEQRDAIIKQLERYGAVPKSEIRSLGIVTVDSAPVRRPLIYSIETPIKSAQIDEAREADETIRQAISDRETEASGCATIPPNLSPEVANILRKTQQESTTHIEQIQSLEVERSQKGGVNKTITVSKTAGQRVRKVG
jgi:hypothetical protein